MVLEMLKLLDDPTRFLSVLAVRDRKFRFPMLILRIRYRWFSAWLCCLSTAILSMRSRLYALPHRSRPVAGRNHRVCRHLCLAAAGMLRICSIDGAEFDCRAAARGIRLNRRAELRLEEQRS